MHDQWPPQEWRLITALRYASAGGKRPMAVTFVHGFWQESRELAAG